MLLLDRFDNLTALSRVLEQNPELKVTIIHGEKDSLIPIKMGRRLSQSVPGPIEFHGMPGASHSTVFSEARAIIYAKLRGQVEEPRRQ
jgi:pimeloyl-ACP methyl ester carboxylesterase